MPDHTVVLMAVLEDGNPGGSRIFHRRSNLCSCEERVGYVVEEVELVSVATHEVTGNVR